VTILAETGKEFESANHFIEPINLHKLGTLFVIKRRYWSCRAGNAPSKPDLTHDRIDAKAITSFGTKDSLDREKTRKRFQVIEKKARHAAGHAGTGSHRLAERHHRRPSACRPQSCPIEC
jgi:CDGSH-type Zn-finger protein